jgi:divalent metal cation (Fe/Co/Zn/Cd) transporter
VHPTARPPTKTSVFVLVVAVPALLVLLLGYSVGYGAWSWLVGGRGAEPAGWVTGAALLLVTVRVGLLLWRRRRR